MLHGEITRKIRVAVKEDATKLLQEHGSLQTKNENNLKVFRSVRLRSETSDLTVSSLGKRNILIISLVFHFLVVEEQLRGPDIELTELIIRKNRLPFIRDVKLLEERAVMVGL